MMQVAVAGSNFKVQNLSKRFAEVKTLKNCRPLSAMCKQAGNAERTTPTRSPVAQAS